MLLFRALPGAGVTQVNVSSLSASGLNGETASVRLEGSGLVSVEAAR